MEISMKRQLATFLFAILLTFGVNGAARAQDSTNLDAAIEKYLMEHPDVILKSLKKYRERDRISATEVNKVKSSGNSPFVGNKDADVTLVEFFDYHCGFCKRFYPTITQLLEEDKNLKVVFKELPIISDDSEIAARASLAVYSIDPEKYFGFHTALMKTTGRYDMEKITSLARQAGLDESAFITAMQSAKVTQELESTKKLAEELGISGTPFIIIGQQLIPGAADIDKLREKIANARQKGGAS